MELLNLVVQDNEVELYINKCSLFVILPNDSVSRNRKIQPYQIRVLNIVVI